ncbi:hypothetical protein Fmac_012034 [Flemingia macrophylla]|uniref:Uncharacterized protein n=1 Tax=Flemingia macrophylla TaxID=520843 RepID=A0ABD1MP51_9FABA
MAGLRASISLLSLGAPIRVKSWRDKQLLGALNIACIIDCHPSWIQKKITETQRETPNLMLQLALLIELTSFRRICHLETVWDDGDQDQARIVAKHRSCVAKHRSAERWSGIHERAPEESKEEEERRAQARIKSLTARHNRLWPRG